MPEGPEIYTLGLAIKQLGIYCETYGKHLYINNQDWSFGLKGTVHITDQTITKLGTGWANGSTKPCHSFESIISSNKLGINWLSNHDFTKIINSWQTSRKALGPILLDQSQIAGIGVAWGSEILHRAGLRPEIPAREQDLTNLNEALNYFKEYTLELYTNNIGEQHTFINEWFDNLYRIRQMAVYKVGTKVEVAGRNWWV